LPLLRLQLLTNFHFGTLLVSPELLKLQPIRFPLALLLRELQSCRALRFRLAWSDWLVSKVRFALSLAFEPLLLAPLLLYLSCLICLLTQ
jgi:hypothetical protein